MSRIIAVPSLKIKITRRTPRPPASFGAGILSDAHGPVETDAEFQARFDREKAAELDRVMTTYRPLPEDLREYAEWSQALDDGTLPPEDASRFSFGSFRRIAAIASSPHVD